MPLSTIFQLNKRSLIYKDLFICHGTVFFLIVIWSRTRCCHI